MAPAAPTSGGNISICSGATVPNVTATAPSGAEVDWYSASTGGTLLASNTTSYATGQTSGTATYYAQSRNNPGSLISATRTAVILTINPVLVPSITATVDDNTPAPGQTINFSSTPTNGGSPTYKWYKNSVAISGATSATYSTNSNYATNDVFYLEMTSTATCASPTVVNSSNITITIDNSGCTAAPLTTATASSITVCNGSSSNLGITGLGGQTGYSYQWETATTQGGTYSAVSGEIAATYNVTNITTALWYRCVVTCSNSMTSTPSNAVQINVTANETPLVSIASSLTPACAGASVTYTATPTFGGAAPTYAWYKNTVLVSGVTGATYTSASFADGDLVYAVMTSNYACLTTPTATSNTALQNITANVTASVSIASSANPACGGVNVTFTATPTNGGSTPTYQWYNGASAISGETGVTYSSTTIVTGSSITVRMTSNANCVIGSPATSNAVVQTITANVTPTLTIVSNNNPVCTAGSQSVTFNTNPVNGGTTPTYAWYLNSVQVATGSSYILNPVTNNDSVAAIMTSNVTCVTSATATSNGIKEIIVSPTAASVSIVSSPAAVAGVVSIHDGTNVTYTATPTFGGTTPTYQWKLNGGNVGTNAATYSTTTLANADVVSCVMTSNYTCLTSGSSPATSNTIGTTILASNPFTPGNLIVYRSGDSVNVITGTTAGAIYLSEYTTGGSLVQVKRVSKNASGVNSIYCSSASTSEGQMTLNANGTNLVLPGYYTTLATASISTSTSAAINRVVALVDINQNVDTTTKLTDWSSGGSPRGATASGNSIYVTGSQGGVRYAAKGATTSTQLSTTVTNMRNVNVFNGQLYASDNSGTTNRLSSIGTGLPTTSGQTMTNLPGTPTTNQPYGFFFAVLNGSVAGLDVVYIADDNANTITKYSLVSGTWTSNGAITAQTVKGLTASISGTTVSLYGTAAVTTPTVGTHIYSYTDATGYNGAITGSPTVTKLVDRSNVSLIAFRGIAFSPTSITTQPSNTTVCVGSTTTMSIAMTIGSSSSIYSYQWQSSANGTNWSNIANGSVYNNVTTATLSILDPTGLNTMQYRCNVLYMGTTTLTTDAATLTVPTTVTPTISISTATSTVCSGNSVVFTASITNGGPAPMYQWKNGTTNVGTNSATYTANPGDLATGNSITCTLTANNNCQTVAVVASTAITMTVNVSPTASNIFSGTTTNTTSLAMCSLGSVVGVYPSISGGVWSSTNAAIASVVPPLASGSSSNSITAVANGVTNVKYTLSSTSSGCTTASSIAVTVAVQATPNAVTGASSLCVGSSAIYSTTSTGGVWGSAGRVTLSASGLNTSALATSAGATSIKYTITNASGCSASSSLAVTLNALPATPSFGYAPGGTNPTGAGGFCANRTFGLMASPANGIWSKTGGITLTPTGTPSTTCSITTGAVAGPFTFTYTTINAQVVTTLLL